MNSFEQRAKTIFLSAWELPEDERDAFVEQSCEGDAQLAERVRALLAGGKSADAAAISAIALGMSTTSVEDLEERLRRALEDRYEIHEEAGRGGMAIVYRARDLKHQRDVALKVLEPDLAAALGPARFLREIQVAAGLQHPSILPLYDSGEADGLLYFVMPFIEGATLSERISCEGPLPVEDALAIAREMANALDHAHGKGLVHRDVKPGNILFQGGRALLADFGLATALSGAEEERLTRSGVVLGTPSYMSPEQALGQDVDERSDLYSLACVVYEMLAGDPPFSGSTAQAVMGRHISDSVPPIRSVRPQLPRVLDDTLAKALAKVPADRFSSASELVEALANPRPAAPLRRRTLVLTSVLLSAAVVLWFAVPRGSSAQLTPGETKRMTFGAGPEFSGTLSPDAEFLVYSRTEHGTMDLYVQEIAVGRERRLTTSDGDETGARWSRDGTRIAYVSGDGSNCDILVTTPLGGSSRRLAETRLPYIHSFWDAQHALGVLPWSPDDQGLVFSRRLDSGEVAVFRVEIEGGELTQVTTPPPGAHDLGASWSFSGDGIVFSRSHGASSDLWTQPVGGGAARPLLQDGSANMDPSYLPDDQHVLFCSNRKGMENLWGLHLATGTLSQLTFGGGKDWYPSVSAQGKIAYTNWSHQTNLCTVDVLTGESEQLTSWTADNFAARFSPQGDRLAYQSTRTGDAEIWIRDLQAGDDETNISKSASAVDVLPAWSASGQEVAFLSDREGPMNLWVARADGSGRPERLSEQEIRIPSVVWGVNLSIRWTPDGESIGYVLPDETGPSLWIIERHGDKSPDFVRTNVLRFDWYLDRNRIVYTAMTEQGLELRAANLGTKEEALLYAGAHTEMVLRPDGGAVALVRSQSHFDQGLYLLELVPPTTADGLPTPAGELKRITGGQGRWHVHNGGWSPDGALVVYTRDTDDGDMFSLTLGDD